MHFLCINLMIRDVEDTDVVFDPGPELVSSVIKLSKEIRLLNK